MDKTKTEQNMKTFEEILRNNCVIKESTEYGFEYADVPLQLIIECQKEYEKQSIQADFNRSAAFDEFIKETESTLVDWVEDFEAQAKRHPYKAKEKLQQAEKHRQILVEFKRHFR